MYQNRDFSRSSSADMAQTTAYVEDYLDCIESLPNDLQRNVSQMREIDSKHQENLREIKQLYKSLISKEKEMEGVSRRRCLVQIQRALILSQDLGDEKLNLVTQIVEQTENRLRSMEINRDRVEMCEKAAQRPVVVPPTATKTVKKKEDHQHHHHHEKTNKRPRRQRTQDNAKEKEKEKEKESTVTASAASANDNPKPAKKKKRSKTKDRNQSPIDVSIDPNEPTYCLCRQVSYGEMVGCDHKDCPYEWFHFGCVGLTNKPKGKWYCPPCIQMMKKNKSSK